MKPNHSEDIALTIILVFAIGAAMAAVITAVTMTRNMVLGDVIPLVVWMMLGMAAGSATLLIIASAMLMHNWKVAAMVTDVAAKDGGR